MAKRSEFAKRAAKIKGLRERMVLLLAAHGFAFERQLSNEALTYLCAEALGFKGDWRSKGGLAALFALLPSRQNKPRKEAQKRVSFYTSREWRDVRYRALRAADGRCQLCGASKHDGAILHVDHIMPRSKFPRLQLELTNLQVLCEDCNLGKSNKDTTDWRAVA